MGSFLYNESIMASSSDYLTYVLELLRNVPGITYKKMMGEYLLYANGLLFGGIYDNRFLLKRTPTLDAEGLRRQIPYPGARPMALVDVEDPDEVARLVSLVLEGLQQ